MVRLVAPSSSRPRGTSSPWLTGACTSANMRSSSSTVGASKGSRAICNPPCFVERVAHLGCRLVEPVDLGEQGGHELVVSIKATPAVRFAEPRQSDRVQVREALPHLAFAEFVLEAQHLAHVLRRVVDFLRRDHVVPSTTASFGPPFAS